MKKQGQAATEFLLTYGWAFLIIIGIIAATYQLGVFESIQNVDTTTRCQDIDLIICENERSSIYEEGMLQLSLRNRGANAIDITRVDVKNIDGQPIEPASCVNQERVRQGERTQITCVDVGEFDFLSGERTEVTYEIDIKQADLDNRYIDTYTRTISAQVQEGQPASQYNEAPSDLPAVLNSMRGDGTPGNPYQITNIYELQAIHADTDAYYELQNDIHARDTKNWNDGKGFLPIGDASSNQFTGFFQGNDYTIHNIYIRRPTENYVGIFRRSSSADGFENFIIKNAYVQGNNNVGAFSGHNARASKQIRGVNNVVTGSSSVGGLVGGVHLRGLRELEVIGGSVTGSTNVGGVIGNLGWSSIHDSYARTTVSGNSRVGGLVGKSGGGGNRVIQNSYAASDIPGAGQSLVGKLGNNHDVVQSYYDNTLPGSQASTHGTPLPPENMTGTNAETNMTGFDFTSTWTTTNSYPELQ